MLVRSYSPRVGCESHTFVLEGPPGRQHPRDRTLCLKCRHSTSHHQHLQSVSAPSWSSSPSLEAGVPGLSAQAVNEVLNPPQTAKEVKASPVQTGLSQRSFQKAGCVPLFQTPL